MQSERCSGNQLTAMTHQWEGSSTPLPPPTNTLLNRRYETNNFGWMSHLGARTCVVTCHRCVIRVCGYKNAETFE
jgi:hypothetical protein